MPRKNIRKKEKLGIICPDPAREWRVEYRRLRALTQTNKMILDAHIRILDSIRERVKSNEDTTTRNNRIFSGLERLVAQLWDRIEYLEMPWYRKIFSRRPRK